MLETTEKQSDSLYFTKGLLVATVALVADMLSKWYMLDVVRISARSPITVTPFFDLVMVWNYGISFGMLAHGTKLSVFLLIILALAITAVLLRWMSRTDCGLTTVALGLVIGGALGNVIDRLRYGAVADFFYFHIDKYYWPAFNVADSCICVGVALLCIESMLPGNKTKRP